MYGEIRRGTIYATSVTSAANIGEDIRLADGTRGKNVRNFYECIGGRTGANNGTIIRYLVLHFHFMLQKIESTCRDPDSAIYLPHCVSILAMPYPLIAAADYLPCDATVANILSLPHTTGMESALRLPTETKGRPLACLPKPLFRETEARNVPAGNSNGKDGASKRSFYC